MKESPNRPIRPSNASRAYRAGRATSASRPDRAVQPHGPARGLNSVAFAHAARALSIEARQLGHEAPSFRSPPRIAGVRRSITRRNDGTTSVAIATRNRSALAVVADMVEGVVVSTEASGSEAGALRDALWEAIGSHLIELLGPLKAPSLSTAS